MTRKQINQQNMFKAVQAVLNKFSASYAGKKALEQTVTKFTAQLTKLDKLGTSTATGTSGSTSAKNNQKLELTTTALALAGEGYAYASSMGDKQLQSKLKFSKVQIYNVGDVITKEICKSILDTLTAIFPQLGDYDITQADLDAYKAMIDGFDAGVDNKTNTKTSFSLDIDNLAFESEVTRKLVIEQLDPMLRKYAKTDKDFYKSYRIARQIIDLGGGKKATVTPATPN